MNCKTCERRRRRFRQPSSAPSYPDGIHLYEVVKDFQELIVGTVGFLGVIWTLRENGRLSRDQHERSVEQERNLIRRALLAELRRNRTVFTENLADARKREPGASSIMMPNRTISQMYDRLFDRLGHLTEEQISSVLDTYSNIKAVPNRIIFAQSIELDPESWRLDENIIEANARFIDTLVDLMQNALNSVNETIALLAIG